MPERRFRFLLAVTLGKTLKQLNAELGPGEISWWMAYYSIAPFGPDRDDLRQGITSAILSNQWKGKDDKPSQPHDFMMFAETDMEQMSDKSLLAAARDTDAIVKATNEHN